MCRVFVCLMLCAAGVFGEDIGPLVSRASLEMTLTNGVTSIAVSNLVVSGSVVYTNTVWDDMTVSALTLNTGRGAPGLVTYLGSVKQMNYDSGDSSFGQVQFSHKKKPASDAHPHIHWSTIDDRSGVSDIEFTLVGYYGDIFGALTNSYSNTVVCTGTNAYIHNITDFDPFGGDTGLDESSIFMFEILCDEDGGTNDKLFIHDIDFHYQVDKPGSDEEIP